MNRHRQMLKTITVLAVGAALAGCASRGATVRPIQTVADQAALEAGDLRIAASALQGGDINVARSLYGDLVRSHPEIPAVWIGLGDAHFLVGEFDAARTAYAKAEQMDHTSLDARLGLARVAVRLRHLDEARDRFTAILAEKPDQPVALAGLGVVHDLQGQPDLAQQTYRKGLELHPGDEALRTNLGLSLALNGKPREAINTLLGHSGVTDGLPQARDNLALAYGMLGREDAAEDILMSYQPRGLVQDNLAFYRYLRQTVDQSTAHVGDHGKTAAEIPTRPAPRKDAR